MHEPPMSERFRNDSPGALTLEQARALEIKRNKERRRQAEELAAQGRGEDTEIAHVARGELVVPEILQNAEVLAAVRYAAKAQGIPFDRLRVGNRRNSINPKTGMPEFFMRGDTILPPAHTLPHQDDFRPRDILDRREQILPVRGDFKPQYVQLNASGGMENANGVGAQAAQTLPVADGPIEEITVTAPPENSAAPKAPWRTITKDMLRDILYNEMSSFEGDPQEINRAMWATASVIMNRQAAGKEENFEGGSLASPTISAKEMAAIQPPDGGRPNPRAKAMYDMADQVADLITSAPEAFPSPWPHPHYNHRGNDSKAPHPTFGKHMVQYGPFKTYARNQWLNIFEGKD